MKRQSVRIALAQINCTVGDLEGNCRKITEYVQRGKESGVDVISFPELAVTGYPPEDLLHKPKFIEDNLIALKKLTEAVEDIVVITGFVDRKKTDIYNAAAVIYRKKIVGVYHKMLLPNYGVFDEIRYFKTGKKPTVFSLQPKLAFGVNICEDIWHAGGPTSLQAESGAGIIFNINASPYHAGKIKERIDAVKKEASNNRVFIAYTNLVGGQDELVFDGQSMVFDNTGKIISRASAFKEDLLIEDIPLSLRNFKRSGKIISVSDKLEIKNRVNIEGRYEKPLGHTEEVYRALVLGLRDYVLKNGFTKVVLGLSGGIDSALVAALAVDALGKDNVTCVFMPSRYSSQESEIDASSLAENLYVKLLKISIEQIYKMYLMVIEPHFAGLEKNITEENLQARIRGNILMALSNKFGWLVLTTGNKSEMSTGYATLYGDMAGGFAVIKDVPKVLVYQLAEYRNSLSAVIPKRIIIKEPTAELKPGQKDSDTLPPYPELDPILKEYIEEDKGLEEIVALGFERAIVAKVLTLVDRSEYKRRQAPPGIKITPKAFGRDRRMPITNKYKNC